MRMWQQFSAAQFGLGPGVVHVGSGGLDGFEQAVGPKRVGHHDL